MIKVIRVGEKNNFDMTNLEHDVLNTTWGHEPHKFVNCNSFTPIRSDFPSIVTINPYLKFQEPVGDLSNVKAFRVKVFYTDDKYKWLEQAKCIEFAKEKNIPVLLTPMRYKSIKSAEKFTGKDFRTYYKHNAGYFRLKVLRGKLLLNEFKAMLPPHLYRVCDEKGEGCPSCMNCTDLTYGTKNAEICALNLSVSGTTDSQGKHGICKYNCPDCFAKIIGMGKRPACDRLIVNSKMKGKTEKV